jgi:hypothetical protein
MFVSTKYLSLMKLVAGLARRPLEVEAFAQARERASSRPIERLSLPNHGFKPLS